MSAPTELTVETDVERDLTIFKAVGAVPPEELGAAVAEFQKGEPTGRVLWDLTEADLTDLKPEHVRRLAEMARAGDPTRPVGRTAFVFSTRAAYGLGRMFQILQELKDSPVERRNFIDMDEALRWLGL